jgi:hypothetical protein
MSTGCIDKMAERVVQTFGLSTSSRKKSMTYGSLLGRQATEISSMCRAEVPLISRTVHRLEL